MKKYYIICRYFKLNTIIKTDKKTTKLKSDNAVKNKNEDLLKRYPFAQELVKGLLQNFTNGQDSIVIGLNGEWGSGKSSLLEFIKTEIGMQTRDEPFRNFVFEFNPWRIINQDQLQDQFLKELGIVLGNRSIAYEGLKKDFKKGVNTIEKVNSLNPEPKSKIAISTIASLIKNFSKDSSIIELKKEVDDRLEDDNIKLFIFIDDIDRLQPKEITEIFQLIKLNANFKNTYFLIAFDKKIVIDSLSVMYGNQSEKYLEKIVQIDYTIPLVSNEFIIQIFEKELKTLQSKIEFDLNIELFQNIWSKYLNTYFTTVRHIYRFFNSLEIRLPVIYKDINPYDFILIEIIRIFDYKAYEWVIKNRRNLIFSRLNRLSLVLTNLGVDKKDINESLKNLVYNSTELEKVLPKTKDIIFDLFSLDIYDSYNDLDESIYKNKKIVSNDYFNQYFSFIISSTNIPDSELQNYLLDSIEQKFELLKSYYSKGLIEKFLKRLVYKIEQLEEKPNCQEYINHLLDFSDVLIYTLNQTCWGIIFNRIIDISGVYKDKNGFEILMNCLTDKIKSYSRFQILNNLVWEIYKKNNIHLSLIPSDILIQNRLIVELMHKYQAEYIADLLIKDEKVLTEMELRAFLFTLNMISAAKYEVLLNQFLDSQEKVILLFRFSLSTYYGAGQNNSGYALIENTSMIPNMSIVKFDDILKEIDESKYTNSDSDHLKLFNSLKKEGFDKNVYYSIDGEKIEVI